MLIIAKPGAHSWQARVVDFWPFSPYTGKDTIISVHTGTQFIKQKSPKLAYFVGGGGWKVKINKTSAWNPFHWSLGRIEKSHVMEQRLIPANPHGSFWDIKNRPESEPERHHVWTRVNFALVSPIFWFYHGKKAFGWDILKITLHKPAPGFCSYRLECTINLQGISCLT